MEQQPGLEGPWPDPLPQAAAQGVQKIAEVVFALALLGQVVASVRARQAARTAAEIAAEAAAAAAARTRWAHALHPDWLADASLTDVAGAWGAALPYAQADTDAASALAACEDRLRQLHPDAMRAYGKLVAGGLSPAEAMQRTAPDFLQPSGAPRAGPVPGAAAARRILAVIARLDADAVAHGQSPLTPAELEAALTHRTNASAELIRQVIGGRAAGAGIAPPPPGPADPPSAASAGLAAADWPHISRAGVVATRIRRAAGGQARRAGRRGRPPATPDRAPRLHP